MANHRRAPVPKFVREIKKKPRTIPVFDCEEFVRDYGEPRKKGEVGLPPYVAGNFAIVMPDDGMEPKYKEGDILVISYSGNPRADDLIVLYEENICTVRKVFEFNDGIRAEVCGYKSGRFIIGNHEFKVLGKVVYRYNRPTILR